MTREEAIEILKNTAWLGTNKDREETEQAINMAIEALSADDNWIPVSERLPNEKDGRVLVTQRGEVRIAKYSEFDRIWFLGEMCAIGGEDPIAWMPLPTPYREDGVV